MRVPLPPFATRALVGIAFIAFGIQHWVYHAFVTRAIFAPAISNGGLLPWLGGGILVLGGAALVAGRQVTLAATVIAIVGWATALLVKAPELVHDLHNGGQWTLFCKGIAVPATALAAGFFSLRSAKSAAVLGTSAAAIGTFFLLAAVQHLLYAQFVATLVPAWIPGQLFWTYFSAAALCAGGVGLWWPRFRGVAAGWSGLMIFVWAWILHLPRALHDVNNANETTSFFEALAMAAACLCLAHAFKTSPARRQPGPPSAR